MKRTAPSLYLRALALARSGSQVSIASIERHLRCGYAEAARIVERLRMRGVA